MNIEKRIIAFSRLGNLLNDFILSFNDEVVLNKNNKFIFLKSSVLKAHSENGWFSTENILTALQAISCYLNYDNLKKWIIKEGFLVKKKTGQKKIFVIMAGNIPAVGFHDFLCVLISGNIFIGKLSSYDKYLLPALSYLLIEIEPEFKQQILFSQNIVKDFDALIATGSNNTSRYFEYYFGNYPNIIRKNKNGVAILTGNETIDNLKGLCRDIFLYYGLGCRNVSKLYVPISYSFDKFLISSNDYRKILSNNKYYNNYKYYKSIFQINNENHIDSGFFIIKQSKAIASPVSVIHYETYSDINQLENLINDDLENMQCIVTNLTLINYPIIIDFGKSQFPNLWTFSDGINTLKFFNGL